MRFFIGDIYIELKCYNLTRVGWTSDSIKHDFNDIYSYFSYSFYYFTQLFTENSCYSKYSIYGVWNLFAVSYIFKTDSSLCLCLCLSQRSFVSFFNFQISKYVYRVTDSEMNIRAEIKDLKSEQETISMTEEFAKYAKLQRKIDKHTAEVKRLGMCKHMQSNFVISN